MLKIVFAVTRLTAMLVVGLSMPVMVVVAFLLQFLLTSRLIVDGLLPIIFAISRKLFP